MGWKPRFRLPTIKSRTDVNEPTNGSAAGRDETGIALFMVIAAMTILSVIVTEFTYVAQVNSRSTIDASDQLKAHYLAKTGYKLSLLRLRAYKEVKAFGGGSSGLPEVPKAIADQIWSFPFFYPIPANVPGLTVVMKDEIQKFQDESTLPGHFTATIESESNRVALNSILSAMAPVPAPSPSGKPRTGPSPGPSPSVKAEKFDVEEARKGLREMLGQVIEDKAKADVDFAQEYRDLNLDELYDNILGWVDFSYQPKNSSGKQQFYKRQPFYSLSELRMIYPMDDTLYDLIAPNFTPYSTPGINVNTVKEPMLRALLPKISDEEAKKFFEDRDSTEKDGKFKSADEFYKYVESNIGAYRSSTALDEFKTKMQKQGIQILVDETIFKITVVAEVNKASRVLEAWVALESPPAQKGKSGSSGGPGGQDGGATGENPGGINPNSASSGPSQQKPNAAGLRLLYMRES